MVAPQSVPMKTCRLSLIRAVYWETRGPARRRSVAGSSVVSERAAQAILGRNQVIVIIVAQVDADPGDLARPGVPGRFVFGRGRRAAVFSDVAGLVGREAHRDRPLDPPLADRFAVDGEGHVTAAGQ